MSSNRKPVKATESEVKEFYAKTKETISKTGSYYDSILGKYRYALVKETGKGSGAPLRYVKKYQNYLKRLNEEDRNDISSRAESAKSLGFSALQKARKLFGGSGAAATAAEAVAASHLAGEAKEAVGETPTNVSLRGKAKKAKKGDKVMTMGGEGGTDAVAATKLKKKAPQEDKVKKLPPKKDGDLRDDRVNEGEDTQREQADKIEEVAIDQDSYTDPLQQHMSHDVDSTGETGNVEEATTQPIENVEETEPRGRAKGEGYYGETKEQQPAEAAEPIPLPQEPQPSISMSITDKPDIELDVEKSPSQGVGDTLNRAAGSIGQLAGYVSPASQSVSMERNRMKYSASKLYEEIRAFISIYKDDIKTEGFKKLTEEFKKLTAKSPIEKLRKTHREVEEEVIEYYRGKQGIRLGVIIDPSVLGININQMAGMMSLPVATGGAVREVGTQKQRVQADVHYHNGGYLQATKSVLPEGQNLQKNEPRSKEHIKTNKIQIPIRPPNRWLLQRSGVSRIPKNLKIR